MKSFQNYIFELNKPYEFRIKMGTVDPSTVMEQIKNALNTWQLESVSAVKSLPIQEHREFPQWGACEAWTFDIKVAYPTNQIQIQQTLRERAGINPSWLCVRNLNEAEYTDEAEAPNADAEKGALLDQEDLGGSKEGQSLVGQSRIGSLLKELESREYEVAGSDKTVGGDKQSSYGKTTNGIPQGNDTPVMGKNKINDQRGSVNIKG
jgi:hypothetical protein